MLSEQLDRSFDPADRTIEVLVLDKIGSSVRQLVVFARNLKKLTISGHDITELLPCNIKNTRRLTIPGECFQPLAALLPNATSLTYLEIIDIVAGSDLPALTNIVVQSHPTLEVLNIKETIRVTNSTKLSSLVEAAGNSRLKKLMIGQCDIIEVLNYENTNPKKLIMSGLLILPFAALLSSITSLTYLEITDSLSDNEIPVLTNIVQSHRALEVLVLDKIRSSTELVRQLVVSASNLKKLTISGHDITELLPHNIKNTRRLTIPSECFQPLAALLPNATSLTYLEITGHVSGSDLPALTNIVVQSHPTLEVLNIKETIRVTNSTKLSSLVEAAGNSRLKKLMIGQCDIIEVLNYENTNPKKLIMSGLLILPFAALLSSITSLTYLEITDSLSDNEIPVLTNIVQSHRTLEVLDIRKAFQDSHKNQLQLSPLVEAAGNSQLKHLRLPKQNYDLLPSHIREAHKQMLK